jgi:hypothetical protein
MPAKSDRWVALEPFYELEFAITVVSIELEVTFGAAISVGSWFGDAKIAEIVLQAKGMVKVEAKVHGAFTGRVPPKKPGVETGGGVDIGGQGKINFFGYGYAAKVGLEGGIEFKGEFKGSFDEYPRVEGDLERKKTILYAEMIDTIGKRKPRRSDVELWEKATIWKDVKLPG